MDIAKYFDGHLNFKEYFLTLKYVSGLLNQEFDFFAAQQFLGDKLVIVRRQLFFEGFQFSDDGVELAVFKAVSRSFALWRRY